MSEERDDSICQDIIQVQIANLFFAGGGNEPKQKDEAVPVAMNGMRAHFAEPWEMICEIIPQTASQEIGRSRLHRWSPFAPKGVTRPP